MPDLGELETMIKGLLPPGTVVAYAGEVADTSGIVEVRPGWLLCNGAAVSHEVENGKFFDLFNAIQGSHGNGSDSDFPKPGASFNLPDYRGLFLRGVNDGRNDAFGDPDRSDDKRPANHLGGNIGNRVGSVQGYTTAAPRRGFVTSEEPDHPGHWPGNPGSVSFGNNTVSIHNAAQQESRGKHSHSIMGGDSETRPNNSYVHWLIRY